MDLFSNKEIICPESEEPESPTGPFSSPLHASCCHLCLGVKPCSGWSLCSSRFEFQDAAGPRYRRCNPGTLFTGSAYLRQVPGDSAGLGAAAAASPLPAAVKQWRQRGKLPCKGCKDFGFLLLLELLNSRLALEPQSWFCSWQTWKTELFFPILLSKTIPC